VTAAEPQAAGVPAVASLWVGEKLRWLDKLALASFVHRGHAVTLFHTAPQAPAVPEGVQTRPAAEVFDPTSVTGFAPAQTADLFRLHLMRDTDLVWVDTDALCLRPLALQAGGWLVGHEDGNMINNAVLRMPKSSAALAALIAVATDPTQVPDWLPDEHRAEVMAAVPSERLATACLLVPNLMGPRGLTAMLTKHGEDIHALPMRVLNPLPWSMGDAWFNPQGGVTGWFGPETMVAHLYASRLRKIHLRGRPRPHSFLADFAAEIGFSFAGA
jgi:hypothetical protein